MTPNVAGLAAVVIFSFGSLLYVLALEIPPFQFLAMQFFLGCLSITAFQLIRGKDVLQDWKQPPKFYVFACLGIGVYNILLIKAFHSAPAFEVNMLNYLWPVLIAVLSGIILGNQLRGVQIAGIMLGFAGAVLLFIPHQGSEIFSNLASGHILAVLGAFIWATYSVLTNKFIYPASFLAPIMLICALMCSVFHLMYEETLWPDLYLTSVVLIIGLTRFCYVLWDYAMRHGDQILISSLSYFTPLISAILFIIFGYKPASSFVALGGGLIIMGCLLVNAANFQKVYLRMAGNKK